MIRLATSTANLTRKIGMSNKSFEAAPRQAKSTNFAWRLWWWSPHSPFQFPTSAKVYSPVTWRPPPVPRLAGRPLVARIGDRRALCRGRARSPDVSGAHRGWFWRPSATPPGRSYADAAALGCLRLFPGGLLWFIFCRADLLAISLALLAGDGVGRWMDAGRH